MDTFERVKGWLAKLLGIREEIITPEATLGELFRQQMNFDIEDDSLELVELVMGLEEEFDIEIPDDEIGKNDPLFYDWDTTVQTIVDLIDKKTGK